MLDTLRVGKGRCYPMRKHLITFFIVSLLLCFISISTVHGKGKGLANLATYRTELTGDHHLEKIQVIKKENNRVEMVIDSKKSYQIPLSKGIEPKLIFKDMNQDSVKDIFIAISSKDYDKAATYNIYTLKDDNLNRMILPEGMPVTAQFKNEYKASIQINQTGQTFVIDLNKQKKRYDQQGIYQNGLLNEPTELMVSGLNTLKPVRLRDLSIGLKGRQLISDGYNDELIGYVDSTWKWSNNHWELQNTIVKQVKPK